MLPGAVLSGILASLAPTAAVAAFPGSDGRIAYAIQTGPGGNSSIFSTHPDGSGVQQLTGDLAYDSHPTWSANGRRLVFTRLEGGSEVLFTINADGGDLTRVVGTCYPCGQPAFSPSGRRIAYTTGDSIRTIRADGTGPRRVVTAARCCLLGWPAYSPSGKRIAFSGTPEGEKRGGIWSMRRDGSLLRRLSSNEFDEDPDYSPDGRHIVFHGSGAIRVMRVDGSRERPILDSSQAAFPAYSPAGDRIAMMIGT